MKAKKDKKYKNGKGKIQQSLLGMLKPKPIAIKTTISAPSLVHSSASTFPPPNSTQTKPLPVQPTVPPISTSASDSLLEGIDVKALQLLEGLEDLVCRFPRTLKAEPGSPDITPMLNFSGDPSFCDLKEDAWETLDPMMNNLAGWGASLETVTKRVRAGGKEGLDGLVNFLSHFVRKRRVCGDLMEHKMELIMKAVQSL